VFPIASIAIQAVAAAAPPSATAFTFVEDKSTSTAMGLLAPLALTV